MLGSQGQIKQLRSIRFNNCSGYSQLAHLLFSHIWGHIEVLQWKVDQRGDLVRRRAARLTEPFQVND